MGDGYGDIIRTADDSVVPGRVYCMSGSDGGWVNADKDGGCVSSSLLGVSLGSKSSQGMLLRGFISIQNDGPVDTGQAVFMGDSGRVTGSHSSYGTGDIIRHLGYAVSGSETNGTISVHFNPDNTWIEIA